ncbi:D-alanyl-D-alanine carboxypeptidase/D-alanyl-D-alanine endopeptidase [Henriciella litoralis]|uniref:D-alanyl-D-alanine carboxypeptidase/D-alanyl-D-alanine endopeptidase n=1 Tax=Henriciella litoralis TaxID=568102 RepID=UPI00111C8FD5|nr:D-alanyl-D-alanine carboxypeptidase/D-alanyl-D-alanine-endopeptidase [Henriciella litoralis]
MSSSRAAIWLATLSVAFIACAPLASAERLGKDSFKLPDLEGGRWGISVKALDGEEAVALSEDERFALASTLKLATTATAFDTLGSFEEGKWPSGTGYRLKPSPLSNYPVVELIGSGDPTLSSASDCKTNCLQQIADAIVATGIEHIASVDVNDSLFLPPHWPTGWSHEDFRFGYATAITALSVDGGTARAELTPGPRQGSAPVVEWDWAPAFGISTTEAQTVPSRSFDLDLIRRPGAREAYMVGDLPLASPPVELKFGLDDPALYAGEVLKLMLEQRGVEVHGSVIRSDIRYSPKVDDAKSVNQTPDFTLPLPDRDEFLNSILHDSDNFYTEILLHHISLTQGDRSQMAGLKLVSDTLIKAGADRKDFNLADGSGLSVYNRMTPEAMSSLLVWASKQDWYKRWESYLAVGGEDGTLKYRFKNIRKPNRIHAKTGSVRGVSALAGYFESASGKTYAFAIFANDTPLNGYQTRKLIDDVLENIIERVG